MNDVKLTDYLPAVDEISSDTLLNVRERISTYLKSRYSDSLDMGPNSVFGDLVLSPLSYLIASFEIAASRLFSDIDIANVAAGQIYNCDFVKEYLENFGLAQRTSVPSTGIVQITFSTPGDYLIDAGASFAFTSEGTTYIFSMADVPDVLSIVTDLGEGQESPTLKQLNRLTDSEYVVNIPVIGDAGVSILKNTECESTISIPEVVGVKSITDFDPGTLPENVMELADKTRNTYYAASLTSRNGCLSFILQTYPEIQGVSPVVTGDTEMIRSIENIFGIRQGVMDIFVKSKKNFVSEYTTVPLAYNSTLEKWVGLLSTPQGPPSKITSIQLSNSGNTPTTYEILGSADQDKYPEMSGSYSTKENLGLYVQDTYDSNSNGTPDALENASNAKITPDVFDIVDVGLLNISGEFQGYPFVTAAPRDFRLVFNSYSTDYAKIQGSLLYKNEVLGVEFENTGTTSSTFTYSLIPDDDYNRTLKGVNFTLILNSGPGIIKDNLNKLIELESDTVNFTVTPKSSNFIVAYEYDPMVPAIGDLVERNDIKPINTDILVRGFLTCDISNVTITYRSKAGSLVDTTSAKRDILNYINGLSYPNLYEEYAVAEIMLYYGADGVKSISQLGKFYKTQATKYLDKNLTEADLVEGNLFVEEMMIEYNDGYKLVSAEESSTLQPPEGIPGMGERNVHYIISADAIVFDEVSF